MNRSLISTSDNPYNPFVQFNEWKSFDEVICGYNCLSYLGRVAVTSPELSPFEYSQAIDNACDEIIQFNKDYNVSWISPVTGKETHYIKITENEEKPKKSEASQ